MVEFVKKYKEPFKIPKITKEDKKQIVRHLQNYIFRRKDGDNILYTCTCCGKTFKDTPRLMQYYELRTASHNEYVQCPECCLKFQIKDVNKCGKFEKVNREAEEYERIALIKNKGENEVIFECFFAERHFYKENLLPNVFLYANSIIRLKPGKAKNLVWNGFCGSFQEQKLREPFYYAEAWNPSYHDYTIIGTKRLESSFLKYIFSVLPRSCSHSLIPGALVKPMIYLQQYSEHPIIEMLLKSGRQDIVDELCFQRKPSKKLYNWDAKSMKEFFKPNKWLTSEDRNYIKKHTLRTDEIKLLVWLRSKNSKIKIEDLNAFSEWNQSWYIKELRKQGVDIAELVKYRKKINIQDLHLGYQTFLSFYTDYIRTLKNINNGPLTHVEMFPPHLREAHDRAVSAQRAIEAQRRMQEEAERCKKLSETTRKAQKSLKRRSKEYEFEADGFRIILPRTPEEIIEEGHRMSHCVGGYAERHLEDKLTILFLRSTAAPDDPLATIEMHGSELYQIQGYKDTQVWKNAEGAEAFFNKWLEVVEKRFAAKAQRKTKKSTKNAAA